MPRSRSNAASRATSARSSRATAAPSMSAAPTETASLESASKVHGPRFADHDHLDLSGVLELRLDAPRDLFGERRHANVIHILGRHDHTNLAPGLNREHLFNAAVARSDP